jgi:inhibitor of cysteine peptidase
MILTVGAASAQEAIKAGCSCGASGGTTNISGKAREYSSPAEPIKVKSGEEFVIKIKSNPTTGYSWELANNPDNIILVTNSYLASSSRLMGVGGHELWTFKAVGCGQTNILMKYLRPWEKDRPVMTNVFTVIVK